MYDASILIPLDLDDASSMLGRSNMHSLPNWWGFVVIYCGIKQQKTSLNKSNWNTPPKINIEPENDGFEGCILRFHVNLMGCMDHFILRTHVTPGWL